MEKRRYMLKLPIFFILALCLSTIGCGNKTPINQIPMYGNVPPTPQEQEAHDRFIKEVIEGAGSREAAIKQSLALAWSYYNKKDFETAMKRFNQTWLLDHNNADVYWGFGLLLRERGQHNEALKMYDKALEINPDMPEVYNNRGNLYKDKRQDEQALADFAKAIELKPDFFMPYANRGLLYFNKKEYEKALVDFNHAIEIEPKDAQSYNDRGCTYFFMKQYDKAWDDVHKAQELGYPVHPMFLKDLKKASGREG